MDKTIKFQILNTGQRKLRYLQIRESSLWPNVDSDNTLVLFLGADVLCGTNISMKNMGRSHFNFSKNGHCLKITIPVRLNKVSTSTWFYDLKGLMHVAFTMYSYNEQVTLMRCLFTSWSKITERSLPPDITVDLDDIVLDKVYDFMVLIDQPHSSCQLCKAERPSTEACSQTHLVLTKEQYTTAKPTVEHKKVQTSQDELTNAKRKKLTFNFQGPVTKNFFDIQEQVMREFLDESIQDIFFYKVYHLFETLLFLVQDELEFIETTTTGIFPFHLMVEYANLKKSYNDKQRNVQPDIFYQDGLLNIFSNWLGLQFHNFRHAITSQVDTFKRNLIKENQFLPSPTKLLQDNSLFPFCMINFLTQWLSNEEERREDKDFQNSEILLVLELLNDNLLTGVGHVVYAKLKSTESM